MAKVYEDGEGKFYSIPVYHRIGLEELERAVYYGVQKGEAPKTYWQLSSLTKKKVNELVKEAFEGYGAMFQMYTPEVEVADEYRKRLRQKLKQMFPELVDSDVA